MGREDVAGPGGKFLIKNSLRLCGYSTAETQIPYQSLDNINATL